MSSAQIQYREYAPCEELQPYVECYWSGIAHPPETTSATAQRVVPDGCIDIVFEFKAPLAEDPSWLPSSIESSMVVGTMSRPLIVTASSEIQFLGVRFKPGKAHGFFRVAAGELTDCTVPLDDIWGRIGSNLVSTLSEQHSLRHMIVRLEKELLKRLHSFDAEDPYIQPIIGFILDRRGAVSVQSLSALAGISRQHIARKFDHYVGISPKLFCRVVRFQNMMRSVASPGNVDWASAALDLGYYDQAHMISDFKEFSGLTPTAFLARR
jgi:AraC-like DNA-binding protein